jgi:hypothetical protein
MGRGKRGFHTVRQGKVCREMSPVCGLPPVQGKDGEDERHLVEMGGERDRQKARPKSCHSVHEGTEKRDGSQQQNRGKFRWHRAFPIGRPSAVLCDGLPCILTIDALALLP